MSSRFRAPEGVLVVRVRRRGVLVEEARLANLIVAAAGDVMAELMAGAPGAAAITTIGVGDDGTAPAPSDTGLANAVTKPLSSFAVSGNVATFSYQFAAGDAVGLSIREFGLFDGNGVLVARRTRAEIEKTADLTLDGTWTVTF